MPRLALLISIGALVVACSDDADPVRVSDVGDAGVVDDAVGDADGADPDVALPDVVDADAVSGDADVISSDADVLEVDAPLEPLTVYVDGDAAAGGDGSEAAPFRDLQEAVSAARAASVGREVIVQIAPLGDSRHYAINPSDPLVLDFPVVVRGGVELVRDADGFATGALVPGTETLLLSVPPLSGTERLVSIRADDVTLEGLVLSANDAGLAGNAVVYAYGVKDFLIRDNVITGQSLLGIEVANASGVIRGNFITDVGCGTCIAGGPADAPARVLFESNRSVGNTFGGVLLLGQIAVPANPDDAYSAPNGGTLEATVRGNDLSDNTAIAGFSFGLRIFLSRDEQFTLDDPPTEPVSGHIVATIEDNRVTGNAWAVWIDAGFPFRADDRDHTGSLDLTFDGNTFEDNANVGVITFTRNTTSLTPGQREFWKYARGSSYTISWTEEVLDGLLIDHPTHIPDTQVALDNVLVINGQTVAPGDPLVLGPLTLYVDGGADEGGDGSLLAPFRALQEAIGAARTASAQRDVIIDVAPLGDSDHYAIDPSDPIMLDFPVVLRGGTELVRDEDGFATGEVVEGTETLLLSVPPLSGDEMMIWITADDVTVERLMISANEAGFGGFAAVNVFGADNFLIRDTLVTGQPFVGIETTDASGAIRDNYITRVGCGSCIGGGPVDRPSQVLFEGNRSVGNQFGGVLLVGQLGRQDIGVGVANGGVLEATVRGNDLSDNTSLPGFSFGVRIFLSRDEQWRADDPPTQSVAGHVVATVENNRVTGNAWAVWIDAGFPYRSDERDHTGSLEVTFEGNTFEDNTNPGVISFTRNTTALNVGQRADWKYATGATYALAWDEAALDGLLIDHPAEEPTEEVTLGNVLTINGTVIPPGAPLTTE
jgi:hypothetical protein